MHIRQIALCARELEPAVADLCAVLGIEISFRDPGVKAFGLHNAVMPVGGQFLEVVSPTRADTTAGRYLDKRGGDGGYMVILQTRDLAAERARLASLDVRVVWSSELPDIASIHLHPRDVGGAIVSLDQPVPPESWRWGGPDWQSRSRTERVAAIRGVTIEAGDPRALASRWAQVLGLAAPRSVKDAFELALEPGAIRFAPASGRGDGVAEVELAATDAAAVLEAARDRGLSVDGQTVTLVGVRFRLV
jgi:hypothetical protein